MKIIKTMPHNSAQLTRELWKVPGLKPQQVEYPYGVGTETFFTLRSDGESVLLELPDDVKLTAIEKVLNKHQPKDVHSKVDDE